MQSILKYKTLAFVALIFWLLASWSGAHGHFCFDGQEPPLSMHMDMLGEHPEHTNAEQHADADIDVLQFAFAKLVKIDLPFLITALLLLAVLFVKPSVAIPYYSRYYSRRIIGLRPPLRAPPSFPA